MATEHAEHTDGQLALEIGQRLILHKTVHSVTALTRVVVLASLT